MSNIEIDPSRTGYDSTHKLFKQHATLKQLKNNFNIPINDYFKFTVCRNPFERVVSDYCWFSKRRFVKAHTTLKDYLLIRNGYEKFNHCNDISGRGDHFYTQFKFIEIDGKSRIDFIIRFENLQEDFNIVCDKIGIPRQQLPHGNRTEHKHYIEYYDEETKQMVAEKYAKDIEYFGYKFGQ